MSTFDRAEHCRMIASKGGKALAERYGRDHMSRIGKAGFEATTKRYFQGKHDHVSWLISAGLHAYWKSTGLPMKMTVDGRAVWPEKCPHPAHENYTPF